MKHRTVFSGLAISLVTVTGLAAADATAQKAIWELGMLTCSLAPDVQHSPNEPGQGRAALCHFRPGNKGAEETYVATFQFVGQGKLAGSKTIMLVVKGPVSRMIVSGLLQQAYLADASIGAGKQAPLIGAKDSSVVLQSASEQSELPSMALGQSMPATILIAELKLTSSPA
jgi:hypothetical protein